MNRACLNAMIVLSTVVILTGSTTFGQSKTRSGSVGFNRGQMTGNNGQNFNSFKGRVGNLNLGGDAANNGNPGGIKISGDSNQHRAFSLPLQGNRIGTGNGQQFHSSVLPTISGQQIKSGTKTTLSKNMQTQLGHFGHTIQLPNGTKTKPIAVNVNQVLKHSHLSVQPHIQKIVASAPKNLCNLPHFSWWVNVCHDHCHANYGCWNIHNQYWDCWTPCSWQVVRCEQFTYYVGLNCTYIPDMQAYGVQSVNIGSPAQQSGLQAGDLILTINGQPIIDPNLVNAELIHGRLDLQVIRKDVPAPILLTVFPRLVQTVSF